MSFGIYTILPIRTSWIVRKGSWTMTRQWEPVTLTSDVVTENPDVAVTLYASAFRHVVRPSLGQLQLLNSGFCDAAPASYF